MNGTEGGKGGEEWIKPVEERYGREIVAFVTQVAMAGQAAEVLAGRIGGWPEGAHALMTLVRTFNELSSHLTEERRWTEELLHEVQRAVTVAFAARIEAAVPKLILTH